MKKLLLLFLLLFLVNNVKAYNTISFYVVAHPDDWQLFMSNYTAKDILDQQNKTVIIYMTAGDATFTNKTVNKSNYLSRERGAINAVQFAADIHTKHLNGNFDKMIIKNHAIKRFSCKNTVSYFMRLPDGCDGKGFKGQSLALLRTGKISQIDAVDSTTTYYGWSDVINTMKVIMLNETGLANTGTVNISDTSWENNPGDHHDHINAARAGIQAASGIHFLAKRYFVGYHMQYLPENLPTENIIIKTAIFTVTDFGRTQANQSTSWSPDHVAYLSRCYERTEEPDRHMTAQKAEFEIDDNPGVFPNPAQNTVYVNFVNPTDGDISYNVVNMQGSIVAKNTENRAAGKNTLHVDITDIVPGIYIIQVFNNKELVSFQFVKM